jgi:hypothetical protein
LIGLIPIWGLLPKVAIAYAGTYTTGIAAWRWYESGEVVSSEQLKRISSEAIAIGRARAAEIIARARATGAQARGGILSRIKRALPRRGKPPSLTPPKQEP